MPYFVFTKITITILVTIKIVKFTSRFVLFRYNFIWQNDHFHIQTVTLLIRYRIFKTFTSQFIIHNSEAL